MKERNGGRSTVFRNRFVVTMMLIFIVDFIVCIWVNFDTSIPEEKRTIMVGPSIACLVLLMLTPVIAHCLRELCSNSNTGKPKYR
jgi:nitrogen fixation/metabolism regulation signal transduction histidine kinase